jgi:hypothetical protein
MYWFGLSKPSLRSTNASIPASNAIDSLDGLRQSGFFSDLLGFEHERVLLFTCLLLILEQGLTPQPQGPQKANNRAKNRATK